MGYYGIVVPAYAGHLNPVTVLGRALQKRGHRVALISPPDAESQVRRAGLEFLPVASVEFPLGAWQERSRQAGELTGWRAGFYYGRWLGCFARGILRDLPKISAKEKFDGIVMDQVSIGTEAVCAAQGLPMAVACAALMLLFERRVPPIISHHPYRRGVLAQCQNVFSQIGANFTGWPVVVELLPFRLRHCLGRMKFDHMNELPPSLVQVAQQPVFFDFPRRSLPSHVHCTGPWSDGANEAETAFPWDRLNGRPLIYASLGTLQNRLQHVFQTIAQACAGLDAQLVVALGSKGAAPPANLAGQPVVVDYAPQLQLLERASLVITHGGLNTVLESLSRGLPLVALPIANDQPGVAARVQYLGLGRALPVHTLSAEKLREAVTAMLASQEVRENARKRAREIEGSGRQAQAAELIEQAFTERRRIRRPGS